MRHRWGTVLLAGTALFAAMPAVCDDEEADKAAYETVCGTCHTTQMIAEMRSEPEWIETIDRMLSIGAAGSEGQIAAVQRFLARTLTKVNINTAPPEQLAPVLDVALAAAQAVVEYRTAHGRFRTLDDVKQVPGLDAAKIEARRDRIAFR